MAVAAHDLDGLRQAAAMLGSHPRVALVCHAAPDGDCIGGMLGLGRALGNLGKTVHLLSPDPVPDHLHFLAGHERIQVAPTVFPDVDVIAFIEAPTLDRVDPIYATHQARIDALPRVNLDHHVSNAFFGAINVVAPQLSSICEMLVRLVEYLGAPLDAETATYLLAGIISDTRSFRTSSTSGATLSTASELVAAGAALFPVSDAINRTRRIAKVRLWGRVLAQLDVRGSLLGASVSQALLSELDVSMPESDGLVEFLSDTIGVDVATVFKENPDGTVRVSMRSSGRIDVAALCAAYGGGGHARAAGCTITGNLDDVRERIMAHLVHLVDSIPA